MAVSFDQLGNALLGGDPDETISSRNGKALARGTRNPLWIALGWFLNTIDPGHTTMAIEPDEGEPLVGEHYE